uniref:Uncharacterized protein n=1 Tax=Oryza sativa subsp. japonica TaxID=39947 RepID=Q8H3H3_ORYSJ|nr:hypothetical protein [Oryza sativa Japonica Group]
MYGGEERWTYHHGYHHMNAKEKEDGSTTTGHSTTSFSLLTPTPTSRKRRNIKCQGLT